MNDGPLLPLKGRAPAAVTDEMTTGYCIMCAACLDRTTCFSWSVAGVDLGRALIIDDYNNMVSITHTDTHDTYTHYNIIYDRRLFKQSIRYRESILYYY